MRVLFQLILAIVSLGNCTCNKPEANDQFVLEQLSFTSNPSTQWQVGYRVDGFLKNADFRLSGYSANDPIIALWHPSTEQAGYYPYVGQNRTNAIQIDRSGRWALKPFQMAMEGSNTGQYGMLRFKPPMPGKYRIKVIFEGVHIGLSTTDVHVLKNDEVLFNDFIDGYGGDAGFHPVTGTHPSCTYEGTMQLNTGDRVIFAVGYGANMNHFDDTTGLTITIEMI